MNKSEIVKGIASQTDFTVNEVEEIVNDFLNVIGLSLWAGEDVLLSGFGKFAVRQRPPMKRRNPRTGELMEVPSKRVTSFIASPILRERLNPEGE